jgi:hypothetical protein
METVGEERRETPGARGFELWALSILCIALLIGSQGSSAAPQIVTGVTESQGNTLSVGTTSYAVYYSYPSIAQVGTNLTIELSLHLNQFQGQVEFINGYSLKAQLFVGTHELEGSVFGPPGFNFLYPGATWGPENVTIPLTENNTGVSSGQSANASLAVTLEDSAFLGVPANFSQTEPSLEWQAGNLTIQNGVSSTTTSGSTTPGHGGSQSILPYALVASGAVLMVVAVVLPRGRRAPAPG